jgi:aminoglycoside/choline kinase family phosphotransferase
MLVLLFRPVNESDLEEWLQELGIAALSWTPLAGDVSLRRYYRIDRQNAPSLLAAYYPESLRETMTRFAAAAALLASAGVRVPEIHQSDVRHGWMLLEDLGSATLFELGERSAERKAACFAGAVASATRIAGLDRTAVVGLGSPPLDAGLLRRELEPTLELLFDPAGLARRPVERRDLLSALGELCDRLAADPLVPCHRDFMSRNLVPLSTGIAVIDFQDLRLGPPAYDLASLLNDSYFPDRDSENALLPDAWRTGAALAQYERAVVQRTLKAAGTFARFAARGNPRHLPLIAPTLARALPHLERLEETQAVFRSLRSWWSSDLVVGAHLLE